jgi:hypothetical protein
MLRLAVPSFVIVIDFESPLPTVTFPKFSDAGATVIATVPVLPFPPPTAPLPVTPTQPDVIISAAKVSTTNAPRIADVGDDFPRRIASWDAAFRFV